MRSLLIKAPDDEPISVDDARDHLRIDHTDEDGYLTALIVAARSHVENYCQIALLPQDWRLTLDSFYKHRHHALHIGGIPEHFMPEYVRGDLHGGMPIIQLPKSPLIDVTLIRYVDTNGDQQTKMISDETFARIADNGLLSCISPAYGTSWPQTRREPGAVEIEYTAGYEDADKVPMPIKQAMLLLIGHWYKTREAVNIGNIVTKMDFAVEALLAPYVVPVI